ncbi:MAG: nucleoside hydrolase [Firmicutes bacterium]|nr:nucleoside hydrolase [Bacillota bacterium]
MVTKLILDMDPGIDDAIALILAGLAPEAEVVAVNTVAGNLEVGAATANACGLLEVLGASASVRQGAAAPLFGLPQPATDIHGVGGLGNWQVPDAPHRLAREHAVEYTAAALSEAAGEITLVATGPLTNVALLVDRYPREAALLRRIVIMGGALAVPGNVTPVAEFNIHADPEAAQIVFDSGLPLTLVGLDVTHQVQVYPRDLPSIRATGNQGIGIAAMLEHYFHWAGPDKGCPLHDPLAVMAALYPDWFGKQKLPVRVEDSGGCRGQTVADFNRRTGQRANIHAALSVNVDECLNWFYRTLSRQ